MAEVSGEAPHQNASSQSQWRETDFALAHLTDTVSEVTVEPGLITGLVCANPDASAAIARRLARQEDSTQPTLLIDGTDARTLPLDLVRRSIILSDTDPQLFAGTLRDQVRGANSPEPRERGVRELVWRDVIENATRQEDSLIVPEVDERDSQWLAALHVADADDVVESVNGGLDGAVAEKGRTLSGGQRQRVALARAVAANPAVLVTIEPTSAVDSHTESRVAQRLAQARHGKTTVIVSASVLVLEHCDEVIVLDDAGREIVRGSHRELREKARSGDPAATPYLTIINRSVQSGGEPS